MTSKLARAERTECADCKIAEMERAVAAAKASTRDIMDDLAIALIESRQVKAQIQAKRDGE